MTKCSPSFVTRLLDNRDASTLDAFLKPRTAEAYYLRSNAKAGLVYEGKILQAEYIAAFSGLSMVGVAAYTWLNTILIYVADKACVASLVEQLVPLIEKRGGKIEAFLGISWQVEAVLSQMGLSDITLRCDDIGGLYKLDVAKLIISPLIMDNGLSVRRATIADKPVLIEWRYDFDAEVLKSTHNDEGKKAIAEEIDQRLALKEYFVLEDKERLLSLCSVSGSIPEAVILGSMWTPPEQRRKGYAKAIVSGAIDILRKENPSLEQAVLFTGNPVAAKAYESVGFVRFEDWRVASVKEDYVYREQK